LDLEVQGEKPPREPTKRVLAAEEISRIPGTNGDALRAIGNMPGVARPPGGDGMLIVRGSSPNDTQVFVDGTNIPMVYHFGGLSSVIPSEMLEKLDFYPGNFGPQYGRAMGGVVDHGTAGGAKLPLDTIKMAGKTGTAQVRRITMAERAGGVRTNESLAWRMRDHSLFMAFAPVENPRYAAATIMEHGGFGAQVAAPLIRDTLLYLFDKPKALAALQSFEQSIGGTLEERAARKTAAWRTANGLPPLSTIQA